MGANPLLEELSPATLLQKFCKRLVVCMQDYNIIGPLEQTWWVLECGCYRQSWSVGCCVMRNGRSSTVQSSEFRVDTNIILSCKYLYHWGHVVMRVHGGVARERGGREWLAKRERVGDYVVPCG